MKRVLWLWIVFLAAVGTGVAGVSAQLVPEQPVTLEAVWNQDEARPGDQRVLAIVLRFEQGWHINPDPGRTADSLIPTTVTPDAPAAITVGAPQYPSPQDVRVNYTGTFSTIAAYEEQAVIYLPVVVASGAEAGTVDVQVSVRYQACNERMCLPPRTETVAAALQIVPPTADGATDTGAAADPALFAGFDPSAYAALAGSPGASDAVGAVAFDLFGYGFEVTPSGVWWIAFLLIAAGGGFLLNLTPCVLPVIPIKIMGLSYAAGNRLRCFLLGLTMALGVVAFWMGIGVAIASVTGFDAISELFQHAWFTIAVGVIIAAMAVGMCGLFSFALPQWVYSISPRHDTLPGSFGFGIMTAILSTPCTAPFMASAAAWATKQTPTTTLATFGAIGGGMALPYLVLSAFPALAARMPRTGPASELIKQVMGLLMLAAASYFTGIGITSLTAEPGQPTSDVYWWPVMGFIAAAGGWLAYRTWRITDAPAKRGVWTVLGGGAVVLAGFGGVRLTDDGPIDWVYYTPERIERELAAGHVVVLDFTAEWCLNCKALERTVLASDAVVAELAEADVVPVKVDLTSTTNEAGWAKLAEVGRVAIPALVVYAPDGEVVLNVDWYSAGQVIDAIEEARSAGGAAPDRG